MTNAPRNGLWACLLPLALCLASPASHARTAPAASPAKEAGALASPAWAALWDAETVSWPVPPLVRHADVAERLAAFRQSAPGLFALEEIGRSVEGRPIYHVTIGRGPTHVLLWSQMHGDEPTATAALVDVMEYFRRHEREPAAARMLDTLTLHVVPMLNPDGAERFRRRNAQGIDINRDALRLQTPEGRALKALRDRVNPLVGFNLHNQGWRSSAGKSRQPASISLLSVALDEARTETPGRTLTKRLCAVIRNALEPLAPGRIGRYDDEFEVRAFGDNVTRWGTSVVLIETGAWPASEPDPYLVRLNFVALMSALDAMAAGTVSQTDKAGYETLPENSDGVFYLLIRNASVVTGSGVPSFTADVGIAASRAVREVDGQRRTVLTARIEDLGDLHPFGGLEDVDATGLTVAPLWDRSLAVGQVVTLPDWAARRADDIIETGAPAALVLLRPEPARPAYRVVRVITYD